MRLAPTFLAVISLWGLFCPQIFLADKAGSGRWVFAVIFLLAVFSFWRSRCRRK